MRSLFKLSLAALVGFALATASAWAQDASIKLNLNVMNAFGPFSDATTTKLKDANDTDKTTTASSRYHNDFQTDFLVTGTAGAVTARGLIRFRDAGNLAASNNPPGDPGVTGSCPPDFCGSVTTTNGTGTERSPETNRADIYWKATDQFSIGFMARSLGGQPGTNLGYSVYASSVLSGGGNIGEVVGPVGFFANQRGLDFRFTTGAINVGLMLLDDCAFSCGYNAGSTVSTASKDESSMVPYFGGTFGIVSVGAYIVNATGKVPVRTCTGGTPPDPDQAACQPSTADGEDNGLPSTASNNGSSETVKDKDLSVTGSVTDVNLKVDLGMALIGFEYWSGAQTCDKKLGGASAAGVLTLSKCDNQTDTSTVFGARVNAGPGRVEAHYSTRTIASTQTATAGSVKTERTATTNDIMLGYAIAITPQFTLSPVYASQTTASETKVKATVVSKANVDRARTWTAIAGRAAF